MRAGVSLCETYTSASAASSISWISTVPSRTPLIRKRYSPLGLSPEMRAPSRAASKTLKWHPHSNKGFAGLSGTIRANRASSVTSSTWHCSCGHVMHTALRSVLLRKRTPLMRMRRGVVTSATNGTGCHGVVTASTGMLTGRARGAYRIGAVGGASWAHTRRPKPASASQTNTNLRRFMGSVYPTRPQFTATCASVRKAPRPSTCV